MSDKQTAAMLDKKLDEKTETVLNKVMTQKVDESQGNNMSTKFFNSLGWSSNDARLVKEGDLEENGILERKVFPEVPPHVEYTLTAKGQELEPIIDAMRAFGTKYKEEK